MKKLSNLLAALVFVSLVIFISCSSDSGTPTPVDPRQTQADFMNGTWGTTANQVLYNGTAATDADWSGFTLTISNATVNGGNYSTNGTTPANFGNVWPESGTWTFQNTAGTIVTRAAAGTVGAVNITVVASSSQLELTFNNTGTIGRTAGIEGSWKFTMTPQ